MVSLFVGTFGVPLSTHNLVTLVHFYLDVGEFDFDAGIIIDPENDDIFPHISLDTGSLGLPLPFNNLSSVPEIITVEDGTDHNIPLLFDELVPNAKAPRIEETDSEGDEASHRELVALPRMQILHNDIRRSFSKMLMNTINSAQIDQIQDFAHTFMLPNAPFFSFHSTLRPEVQVADITDCVGPRMFTHYLLGCFVEHPDMYIHLGETQIITSPSYPGSRIVMQVEYALTKTHEIPRHTWIPPPQYVDKMYAENSIEGMMSALSLESEKANVANVAIGTAEGAKVPKKRKRRGKTPPVPLCDTTQRVPQSYIDALHEGAQLIKAVPKPYKIQGQMVMYLDEAHRIQNITLQMHGFNA